MKTCIYTVVKDEQDYLDDFIGYHLNLGIDHIFIYEDIGSESHRDICNKYPDVSLMSILSLYSEEEQPDIIQRKKEGKFLQSDYAHRGLMYIKNNHPDIEWCFSIDADEYITPTEPFPSLLGAYNEYDAVLLYWQNFGASGRIYKPIYDKPIYQIYTKPCGYFSGDWRSRNITKLCWNMKRLKNEYIYGVHVGLCNWVRTDYQTDRTLEPCFEKIFLKHYITKSYEEYKWKLEKRGMMCVNNRKLEQFFELNPELKEKI